MPLFLIGAFFYSVVQFFNKAIHITNLIFPNYYAIPTHRFKFLLVIFVTLNVCLELRYPVAGIRARGGCPFAIRMPMPEASPDINNGFAFRQYDVRLAGQVFFGQTEPISHTMKSRAN